MINIISEEETLEACNRMSVARYGDGELRCALKGEGCTSQRADKGIARELTEIMQCAENGLLVCVPNFHRGPRVKSWARYSSGKFEHLYKQEQYGSAFITRPDSAPWIDTPEYWENVRRIWSDKDITLVVGDAKSITPEMLSVGPKNLPGAKSVRVVTGPRQHAYAEIDRIEEEIGKPSGIVIMCLGATATVLAARLNRKGVHALDLGHIGMFMKHAGAYAFAHDDLTTENYRNQLREKHALTKWGKSGGSHIIEVMKMARELGAQSIVDYGCGRGTLKPAVEKEDPTLRVFEYDPGIPGKDMLPKPGDLVVGTDVLEHVEHEKLNAVLRHIFLLSKRGAYLVISMSKARETLPDGRNAHLVVQNQEWWVEKLREHGWTNIRTEERKGLCVWLTK